MEAICVLRLYKLEGVGMSLSFASAGMPTHLRCHEDALQNEEVWRSGEIKVQNNGCFGDSPTRIFIRLEYFTGTLDGHQLTKLAINSSRGSANFTFNLRLSSLIVSV